MYLYRLKRIGIGVALGGFLLGCSDMKETSTEQGLAEAIVTETESVQAEAVPEESVETEYQSVNAEGAREATVSEEERKLLDSLEKESGQQAETYLYTDMNHDGEKEMVGVTLKDGRYQIWYISGDGSICEQAGTTVQEMDACELAEMDLGTETHAVINVYNMMGTNKQYSILAIHEDKPELIVSNHYGYVHMNEKGDILLDVEEYDAMYDKETESWLGHTWKNTYLYYNSGVYKEYGAVTLTDEEFMNYDNAEEVKKDIQEQNGSDGIVFSYFLRENEILHIQCVLEEGDYIRYFYYTMNIDGNYLWGDEDNYHEGSMQTSFSELEVTYPEGV